MCFLHKNWTLSGHQPKTRNDYEDLSRKKNQLLAHRGNGLTVAVNRESEASQIWQPAG